MKMRLWLFMLATSCLLSGTAYAGNEGDPHYTRAGFFDVHVCNWPENPRFLMALFSTLHFDAVARVSVFAPDGRFVGDLDLTQFRAFKTRSGQSKRVYLAHFDLPEKAIDGWYRAEVSLSDGSRVEARDYVVHHFMAHPTGPRPVPEASDVPASTELRWDPIPGARYYEAFVRDVWAGNEATASGLLTEPHWTPPPGVLQAGGTYVWRIHARDSDGNVLLGDFNHGSLSPEMLFTVSEAPGH
jgi:hypothetical protein